MHSLTLILQVLTGSCLLSLAVLALARQPHGVATRIGKPLRLVIGCLLALAGVGTLIAAGVPFVTFFSAVFNCAVLAALWIGLSLKGAGRAWTVPAALLTASVALGALQPLGLKVLLLPKADTLPYLPVPARTLKTYDAGQWFESVRVGPDGTLYLSSNRGDDYATGDKTRAQGQVIARTPDGAERVVFTLPMGSTAGVLAIEPNGTLFLTGTGQQVGIWRITPRGEAGLMTRLPRGAWPNGLDFGPDGMLYSADSALGVIWRIDPKTGRAKRVIENALLLARPAISLAPGANGIHFHGRDLLVTVSDRTTVLKFTISQDGRFGEPAVLAKGIPGDDFAIAEDGSLFITTHPYNTLVRVAPDGTRTVIADARQNIIGATDAAFGRTPADQDTLYVATDGGAFQKGKSARGALIALKPLAQK